MLFCVEFVLTLSGTYFIIWYNGKSRWIRGASRAQISRTERYGFLMEEKQRIIQELVPGRQITLAHIIANPDSILYEKLGLNPAVEYAKSAIGVLTVSPAETAIIIADIAMKSSGVDLGFVDRFSGSLIVTGTVSQVEAAIQAILLYTENTLGYTVCKITRT